MRPSKKYDHNEPCLNFSGHNVYWVINIGERPNKENIESLDLTQKVNL